MANTNQGLPLPDLFGDFRLVQTSTSSSNPVVEVKRTPINERVQTSRVKITRYKKGLEHRMSARMRERIPIFSDKMNLKVDFKNYDFTKTKADISEKKIILNNLLINIKTMKKNITKLTKKVESLNNTRLNERLEELLTVFSERKKLSLKIITKLTDIEQQIEYFNKDYDLWIATIKGDIEKYLLERNKEQQQFDAEATEMNRLLAVYSGKKTIKRMRIQYVGNSIQLWVMSQGISEVIKSRKNNENTVIKQIRVASSHYGKIEQKDNGLFLEIQDKIKLMDIRYLALKIDAYNVINNVKIVQQKHYSILRRLIRIFYVENINEEGVSQDIEDALKALEDEEKKLEDDNDAKLRNLATLEDEETEEKIVAYIKTLRDLEETFQADKIKLKNELDSDIAQIDSLYNNKRLDNDEDYDDKQAEINNKYIPLMSLKKEKEKEEPIVISVRKLIKEEMEIGNIGKIQYTESLNLDVTTELEDMLTIGTNYFRVINSYNNSTPTNNNIAYPTDISLSPIPFSVPNTSSSSSSSSNFSPGQSKHRLNPSGAKKQVNSYTEEQSFRIRRFFLTPKEDEKMRSENFSKCVD